MSDGSGQTAWSFDAAGNVAAERRTITAVSPSVTESFSYTYNLDGSLASITYPSGRTLAYSYNNAQRQISAVDSANAINYATNATYWATGQLHTLLLGNDHGNAGTTLTQVFNNRLQYSSIAATNSSQTVFSTSYNYADGNGHNNGRLLAETNNVTGSRTQNFTYDQLNRLASWQNGVSGDAYTFDLYGNLLNKAVTLGTAETLNVSVNSFNQITTGGYGYDAAGDMINTGSHAFTFDAESRETSAGTATYKYDGDSLRVYKLDSQTPSNDRLYWRGGGISVLSESDLTGAPQKDLYYFGGKLIAYLTISSSNHRFIYSDWQGSIRAITNSAGSTTEWAADYYPWGMVQNQIANSVDWRYRWVGQEYDPEVQHYNFPFRFYRPQTGNFMSPDPAWEMSSDASNPQSLDRYAYVLGDPVNLLDPLGLWCTWDGSTNTITCSVSESGIGGGGPTEGQELPGESVGGGVGAGSGAGGTASSASPTPTKTTSTGQQVVKVLQCASNFADSVSPARLFGNNAIANAFLGNSVSGLVNLGLYVTGNRNDLDVVSVVAGGGSQGLPFKSPGMKGAAGIAQDTAAAAYYTAIAGGNSQLISLGVTASGQSAVHASEVVTRAIAQNAGEFATGVGEAKLAYDVLSFATGAFGCALGAVH